MFQPLRNAVTTIKSFVQKELAVTMLKGHVFNKRGGVSHNPEHDMTGYRVNVNSFYVAYRYSADVTGCVDRIKDNTGIAGHRLIDPEDENNDVDEAIKQQFRSILGFQKTPWNALRKLWLRDKKVAGNAYFTWIKNGNDVVVGLQHLDPRTMAVVMDKSGVIHKYLQRVSMQEIVEFEPYEIIHICEGQDHDNPSFGISKLESILIEVRTDMEAASSKFSFFRNNAMPSTWYILDPEMGEDEKKQAIETIKEEFAGSENMSKPMAIEGVTDIKTFNFNSKDIEFLTGREYSTEKITAVYAVPKAMLGYTKGMTFNNVREMMKSFYKSTIRNEEGEIDEVMNREILPALNEDFTLAAESKGKKTLDQIMKYVTNKQSFLDDEEIEDRALNKLAKGTMTIREFREEIEKPIPDELKDTPNLDAFIIHQGGGARLLEDIGADLTDDLSDPEKLENMLKKLDSYLIKNDDQE